MSWNKSLTDLQNQLANLFPMKEDIRPIVQKAGLNISQIAISDKSLISWFNVLVEARRLGLLDELIAEARSLYPEDAILAAINAELIDQDHEIRLDLVKELCADVIREGQYTNAIPLVDELIERRKPVEAIQEKIVTRFAEIHRHLSMKEQGKHKAKAARFLSLAESDLIKQIMAL